ncbi:MAG: tyrosine-type recombinase/integrase, partial [Syntrophobacterales bacterium]
RFYPALMAADLPRVRFHDLRHTYCALLLDQGENIKYIKRQMGHSCIQVTMDIIRALNERCEPRGSK